MIYVNVGVVIVREELRHYSRTGAAVTDVTSYRRQQAASLRKRKIELTNMQDRLLNAYLAGTIDEGVFQAKSNELKAEATGVEETMAQLGHVDPTKTKRALERFDWTPNAAEIWRRSKHAVRRELLDSVCLNRVLGDLTLVT